MVDKEMLEAIQYLLQEELKPIKQRLDIIENRLDNMEEDIKQIKEDAAITRAATNSLLDWADDASIQVIPLFKKRRVD